MTQKPKTRGKNSQVEPLLAALSKNLKLWMDEKDLGQKRLAQLAGVNETYVRDILDGSSLSPQLFKIQKLCAVLDCSIDDLLFGSDASTRSISRIYKTLSPDNQREVRVHAQALKRLEDLERAGAAEKTSLLRL